MAYRRKGYRRKLDDAQLAELVELREQGWGYIRLARRYGVSKAAIHYQCLRHGAVSPRQRRHPAPAAPRSFVAGDGRTQRRFTAAEDERLLRLEAQGLNFAEIARRLGRNRTSVRVRLMTLAQREELPLAAEPAR